MNIFENEKLIRIGNKDVIIQRAGIKHFFCFYKALTGKPVDIKNLFSQMLPFLGTNLSGEWTFLEINSLADAILHFNLPEEKSKKKKTDEKIEVDKIFEDLVFSLAEITGWTIQHIKEEVPFFDAISLTKHYRKEEDYRNIQAMVNTSYGYHGGISSYIRQVEMKSENLDDWAEEEGFEDFDDFMEAEKKRWAV